jgi:lysine 2,3-aminomutase
MKIEHISLPFKRSISPKDWCDWRWQYRKRIRTPEQLTALLDRPLTSLAGYGRLLRSYPFCITPYYLSLVDPNDENDPIRKQCFPDLQELDFSTGGVADPLGEEKNMPVPGLVHRYPDRCLAIVTNVCVVYCRHCNRKRRWGKGVCPATKEELQAMIGYISRTSGIREVIVSGGDPLTLDEGTLDWFLGEMRSLPHVKVIRIGSRIPVVLPMRITKKLCTMLRRHRPLWFNMQFNHAQEITVDSARACGMLLDAGIPLSNQSVLLKGVNDTYEALQSLFYGLQRIGVRPYYLFQCDAVAGTGHFRVEMNAGIEIMEKLRRTISGLCLPRYVLDTPGEEGKIPLAPVVLSDGTSLLNVCK